MNRVDLPRDIRKNQELKAAVDAPVMDYILTLKGGSTERWDGPTFNAWVASRGEKIGLTFQKRLEQFREYTHQDIVDWEMDDRL